MPTRTLVAATAAVLASLATPAGAAPAVWVPTSVVPPAPTVGVAAAFDDGTGLVVGLYSVDASKTWHNGVWSTTDHGLTWSADPFVLPQVSGVAFASPTDWWATTATGLTHSTDAGASWTTVPLPLASGERLAPLHGPAARDGAVVVTVSSGPVSCRESDAILFSNDGGTTWERHDFPAYTATGGSMVSDVEVASDDVAVALVWNSVTACGNSDSARDVYVTTDGGATWDNVLATATTGPQVFDAAISPDGATIVVGDNSGTTHVSTDGGATWTTAAFRHPTGTPIPEPTTGAIDAVVDVAYADGVLYATLSGGSIWRSTDDGATWALDGLHGRSTFTTVVPFDADRAFSVSAGVVMTRLPL